MFELFLSRSNKVDKTYVQSAEKNRHFKGAQLLISAEEVLLSFNLGNWFEEIWRL